MITVARDAQPPPHLCLMTALQASLTGKEDGPVQRRHGAATLVVQIASLLQASRLTAVQVSKTGRKAGLSPKRRGVANQAVQLAPHQAFHSIAKQVSQTGKKGGPLPRSNTAVDQAVQIAPQLLQLQRGRACCGATRTSRPLTIHVWSSTARATSGL